MDRTVKCINTLFIVALFCTGVIAWGHSALIYAKAKLAQYLIADAWQETLATQKNVKPWPWADTWPVATLEIPEQGIQLYVLAGASGTSLAFGPGHIDGTAPIESTGTKVISGHRDTHFSALEFLDVGDTLILQDKLGRTQTFSVISEQVVNINDGPWQIEKQNDELHLITCFPFSSIVPGGPLRYVAVAKPKLDNLDTLEAQTTLYQSF